MSKSIHVARGIGLRLAKTKEHDTLKTEQSQRMGRPSRIFRTIVSRQLEAERSQVWSF